MEFYLQKFKRTVSYISLCIFVLIFLGQCSKDQDKESILYSNFIVNKETDRFIAFDDIFEGEQIYLPAKIKQHPVTKEIFVLDLGNHRLYFFDESGKFLRRIGDAGQGPGDLLRPFYMQIDDNGDIYVYEGGNSRISIFKPSGKFVNSFRIVVFYNQDRLKFAVNQEQKVIFNLPYRKYYFTVFDRESNIEDIGEIRQLDFPITYKGNKELMNERLANGIPFVDNDDNYGIFLIHLPEVLVFNKNGDKILEKNLENVLEITEYNDPTKPSFTGSGSFDYLYCDIIKSEDHYFFAKMMKADKNNKLTIDVIKLDMEFNFVDKYHFIFYEEFDIPRLPDPNICIINEGKELLFAIPGESEILRFSIK